MIFQPGFIGIGPDSTYVDRSVIASVEFYDSTSASGQRYRTAKIGFVGGGGVNVPIPATMRDVTFIRDHIVNAEPLDLS